VTVLPPAKIVDKPLARHFEVGKLSILVFGPGHGEALVVIFPDCTVGVIDGCREPRNGHPSGCGDPVREFLCDWHAMHAQTNGRLRFVALTHPHDDHYAGLGRLIEAYSGSIDEIWCTVPTGGHYANAYYDYERICEDNPDQVPGAEDCKGLARIYNALKNNRDGAQLRLMQRGLALLKTRLRRQPLQIHCIAPSDNDLMIAQGDLMHTIKEVVQSQAKCRPRHDPNLTSAALLVTWGKSQILLGGDLLCQAGAYEGWSRAAENVRGHVQLVKAAHHASEGAQDWELAIVTPFREGSSGYPPQPHILRQLGKITSLAITSPPQWVASNSEPQPTRTVARRPRLGRNSVLPITAAPVPGDDAVGVSFNANGKITQILLTGRADLYR
jgi:hypothetical protein